MLFTRFDSTRLRAVSVGTDTLRRCARTDALVAACLLDAGPADRPWWQPWARPRIERPFVLLRVDDLAVAQRACLWLDGSWHMLDAGSGAARASLRLRTKWSDAAWWRPLQPGDPWDAGVADRPERLAGFRPRRATLIVVEQTLDPAGSSALATLQAQATDGSRAVRVVLVDAARDP